MNQTTSAVVRVVAVCACIALLGLPILLAGTATAAGGPTITLSQSIFPPAGGTTDVTGAGFGALPSVRVTECTTTACGPLQSVPVVAGAISLTSLPVGPAPGGGDCLIQACYVVVKHPTFNFVLVGQPIFFENSNSSNPPPTITATPSALPEGQAALVSGHGWFTGFLPVRECAIAFAPAATILGCSGFTESFADSNGDFGPVSYWAQREFDTAIGPQSHVDCTDPVSAPNGCFIAADQANGTIKAASPITFTAGTYTDGNGPVQPTDPATGTKPVAVTFSAVTDPGVTTVSSSTSGPTLPAGYQVGALYYDIATDATYVAPVTLCFTYDPVALPTPVILHYESGAWHEVPTTVSTEWSDEDGLLHYFACGDVSSLSPFVVTAKVSDATPPTATLTTPPDGAIYARGGVVNAVFSCADEEGGSGLASCVGTVASGSPVDTSTAGTHSFTVTAADNAANSSAVTHQYTVMRVATTKDDCKQNGWQHVVDSSFRSFKNQGDCVSFVATGGRNGASG